MTDEAVKGDFSRTMAGREIWFNNAKPGQVSAYIRTRDSLKGRLDKIRGDNALDDAGKLAAAQALAARFDNLSLDLIESLLVDEADADFIASAMIRGEIGTAELLRVLFTGDDEPEDDVEPTPKPKKAAKAARVTKKTANATRVRR